MRDYRLEWTPSGFQISNPVGRAISSTDVKSVYWRKPFTSKAYSDITHPDHFFSCECRYLIREVYNVARASGAFALVEEGAERRLGKIRQLLLARDFFKVPAWRIISGVAYTASTPTIVKSLSGEQVNGSRVLYTTRVDGEALDPSYTWFTQEAIDKSEDVTICYVNGRLFAFALKAVPGVFDWRRTIDTLGPHDWYPYKLSQPVVCSTLNFMRACDLRYGRLDSALRGDDLFFLEVNPNGQWAWLDLEDRTGLITAMVNAVAGSEA